MDLTTFDETYSLYKGADKISIACDHPEHVGGEREIGKTPARRNILKNGGDRFICRECCMKYDNPGSKTGSRQTDKVVAVNCPICGKVRGMKMSCYYGSLELPYRQECGSCVQKRKTISDEHREAISESLAGRKLTEEHRQKISEYMKTADNKHKLVPGAGGGWNRGKVTPEEVREKQSQALTGVEKSEEHRENISKGMKKK